MRTKILIALLAGLCLSAATLPVERTELAPMGPSEWVIFAVDTSYRSTWPENTIQLTISSRPDRLSVPSGLIFYDRARLPDLLAHYGVSVPAQLTNRIVSISDRDNPILEPIVKVGMSLSNMPDQY